MNLKEIARKAGVSHTSVSLVLNNKSNVGDATRQKVLKIVRDLQFVKRKYDTKKQGFSIVLYIAESYALQTGFYANSLFLATQEALLENGYLCVMATNEQLISDQTYVQKISKIEYQGIIIAGRLDPRVAKMISGISIPKVGLDFVDDSLMEQCSLKTSIRMNNFQLSRKMTLQLIQNGSKRIAFLGSNHYHQSFNERFFGYLSGVVDGGLKNESSLHWLDPSFANIEVTGVGERVKKELQIDPTIDTIFAANDNMAFAVIKALKQNGMQIPNQIQVVGFDRAFRNGSLADELTTIEVDFQKMATTAVRCLFNETNPQPNGEVRLIPGKLFFGRSTRSFQGDVPIR